MTGVAPFCILDLKDFLYEKYGTDAEFLCIVLDTLKWFQDWHGYKTIRISYPRLAALINYKYDYIWTGKKIGYFIHILIQEGVIEKVARGQKGYGRIANGYEFRCGRYPRFNDGKDYESYD